ncbi:MAG TPA: hypothetical protein VFT53_00285 [Candidatus Saccharimonadales bacterium]|nr:hypothetical protein [Candidatus Saccharimonadales bacterium]
MAEVQPNHNSLSPEDSQAIADLVNERNTNHELYQDPVTDELLSVNDLMDTIHQLTHDPNSAFNQRQGS